MRETKRAAALCAVSALTLMLASSSVLIGETAPNQQKVEQATAAPAPQAAAQGSLVVVSLNGHPVTADGKPAAAKPAPKPVLEPGPAPKLPPTSVTKGHKLAAKALSYQGVPYRWAGMTSRGMDCSGLVSRVLKDTGVKAPHNAAALSKLGVPVSYKDLQRGDLVFFKTRGHRIGHVGVYLGDDRFVHASSGTGRVVVTSLSDPYYSRRLVCARRVH